MFKISNRVKEISTSAGSGSLILEGPYGAFQSFANGIGDGNTTYYTIENDARWEVGQGTYNLATNSLSRDIIFKSSNNDSKINLEGVSIVFCVLPAEKAFIKDPSDSIIVNNLTSSGSANINTISVNSINNSGHLNIGRDAIVSGSLYLQGDMSLASGSIQSNNITSSGELISSGFLTLIRPNSAGNFFHAYKNDGIKQTISLYVDNNSSPLWRLGLKTNPNNKLDPPSFGYVYGRDGAVGLISNTNNGAAISDSTGFSVLHNNNTVFRSSSSAGIYIKPLSSTAPGLVITAPILGTEDLQRWNRSDDTTLTVVSSGGKLGILRSNPIYEIDVNGSGRLQFLYIASGIYFSDGTFQPTAYNPNIVSSLSGWASSTITNSLNLVSGWVNSSINNVSGWANSSITGVSGWAAASGTAYTNTVSGWVNSSINNVSGWTNSSITGVSGWAAASGTAYTNAVSGWTNSSINNVSGWANSSITGVSGWAAASGTAYTNTVSGWVNSSINNVSGWTNSSITGVSGWTNNSIIELSGWSKNYTDSSGYTGWKISDGTSNLDLISNIENVYFSGISGITTVYQNNTLKISANIPSGGLENQILYKVSDTSDQLAWIDNYATELREIVKNDTGSDILIGTVVMATGAIGDRIRVAPAVANGTVEAKYMFGIASEKINNGGEGYVTVFGPLQGITTSGYALGDILYIDPANAGGLTKNKPTSPNLKMSVAIVTRVHQQNGRLFIRFWEQQPGLHELHDTILDSVNSGDIIYYDSSVNVWKPVQNPSGWASSSIANVSGWAGSFISNVSGWTISSINNVSGWANNSITGVSGWAAASGTAYTNTVSGWASNYINNVSGWANSSITGVSGWAAASGTAYTNTVSGWANSSITGISGWSNSTFLKQHPIIAAASSSNNSNNTFIQDLFLDSNGHVTGIATATATGGGGSGTSYSAGSGLVLQGTEFSIYGGSGHFVYLQVESGAYISNGITIPDITPSSTQNKLYNNNGNLYFNGSIVGSSGGGSSTGLASGQNNFEINLPPAVYIPYWIGSGTYGATFNNIQDRLFIDFDDTVNEFVTSNGFVMPRRYTGSGTLKLDIYYMMASATSGSVVWGASMEAITPLDPVDLDASGHYDIGTSSSGIVPSVAGYLDVVTINLNNNKDNVSSGDYVRLRLNRSATSISDTAAGDARILLTVFREEV